MSSLGRSATARLLRHAFWWLRVALGARRARQEGALRILTYHGVVADAAAAEPLVPPYYVTERQLARQLRALRRWARFASAEELRFDAREGLVWDPDGLSVLVTFDDGARNVVELAQPVLDSCGVHAVLFVTTGHIGTDRPFPADALRALRLLGAPGRSGAAASDPCLRELLERPAAWKELPSARYRERLQRAWEELPPEERSRVLRLLGPAHWDELLAFAAAGHTLGAHTAHHAILSREPLETMQREIEDSFAELRSRGVTGRIPFAYPNGSRGDYTDDCIAVLRALDAAWAATTVPGPNRSGSPRFELRRNPVAMGYPLSRLRAELLGLADGWE
ncbi:MAG: hypothetical protein D6718_10975 [Acidobacteria bacterium]|nr:MAG: hypothetical protein D6718_10975 [Acidobacteriota bacterium]